VIADDLRRIEQHGKWLAYHGSQERKGPEPPPGFLDCPACPLARECEDEEERRDLCASCPYEHEGALPRGPSLHFRRVCEWAGLPESILAMYADRLSYHLLKDVAELKEYRAAKMGGFGG